MLRPWNKGLTKEDAPQLANSGVKSGNIPWNKDMKGEYSMKHDKQFQKGVAPIVHKDGCKCFRCDPASRKQAKPKVQHAPKTRGPKPNPNAKAIRAEKQNYYNLRRTARKHNAEGSHTLEEWQNLKKTYNYMCLCCKRYEPEIKLSQDHIIPLSKGGTDYIWNIQLLCRSCNSRKRVSSTSYLSSAIKYMKERGGGIATHSN